MKKYFITYFLLIPGFLLFSCGNKSKHNESIEISVDYVRDSEDLSIDAESARQLNLLEIAGEVTPIALEESPDGIQNILLTNEYLFVASIRSIVQYDLSGKLIRRIDCDGYVTDNVTSDTVKMELYVAVRDKIKCYDYSGKFIKEYSLRTNTLYCLYHEGVIWTQSYEFKPDKSTDYFINKINPSTGEVTTLPFEKKDAGITIESGNIIQKSAAGRFTVYNDEVVASFGTDNVIYIIQQDSVKPFIRWSINPSSQSLADNPGILANGFIGEYLFINYHRNDQSYIYLENMKTGKKYNASKIIDDVFHTDGNCRIKSLYKKDYFYFIKGRNEIKGNSIKNVPLRSGPVVFIVKAK